MKTLTKSQVLLLHKALLEMFGGAEGLRDEGLLDSALAAPFHSFGGQEVLKSVQQKAVRLGFGLVKNHAFVDGNKRVGVHVMLTTLEMNGIALAYKQQELINIILDVATGNADYETLLKWVLDHEA
ncbi:MAG: type II toxin-antitoxin system death-on-curing family toxin [Oscillospiraceae bacterium]|nr:type II toxin-antitoxin system death-on-curing family toxin [Oscillospiraceae bacterium]